MRLHLVDGTFELFRAHFSKRPDHRTPQGQPFKATAGLVSSLLALLHDQAEAVTHVAVAFDNPIVSFRNALFPGYKSDAGVPDELRAQFDQAEEAVRALGVVAWSMDRHEADDALATAAVRFADQVSQVRILTPDKDLAQVLSGQRVVQVDRIRGKLIEEATLMENRGIRPASVPDWLALVGDTADGIPGLPGWGARSASALLGRYRHIEAIPSDPEAWDVKVRGAARLSETLQSRLEDALLYKRLATLDTEVPLAEDLDGLRFEGVPSARFRAWCAQTGLGRYADRPARVS